MPAADLNENIINKDQPTLIFHYFCLSRFERRWMWACQACLGLGFMASFASLSAVPAILGGICCFIGLMTRVPAIARQQTNPPLEHLTVNREQLESTTFGAISYSSIRRYEILRGEKQASIFLRTTSGRIKYRLRKVSQQEFEHVANTIEQAFRQFNTRQQTQGLHAQPIQRFDRYATWWAPVAATGLTLLLIIGPLVALSMPGGIVIASGIFIPGIFGLVPLWKAIVQARKNRPETQDHSYR